MPGPTRARRDDEAELRALEDARRRGEDVRRELEEAQRRMEHLRDAARRMEQPGR